MLFESLARTVVVALAVVVATAVPTAPLLKLAANSPKSTALSKLIAQEPFRALLKIKSERIILVNWLRVFEISVRLLRDLAKARSKGFTSDSTIQQSLRQDALKKLESLSSTPGTARETSINVLLKTFPILSR